MLTSVLLTLNSEDVKEVRSQVKAEVSTLKSSRLVLEHVAREYAF